MKEDGLHSFVRRWSMVQKPIAFCGFKIDRHRFPVLLDAQKKKEIESLTRLHYCKFNLFHARLSHVN